MEEESKTLRVYISGAISGTNLEYTRSEFRELTTKCFYLVTEL
jgi:hypothetical protein